jgi:hypothetical protein
VAVPSIVALSWARRSGQITRARKIKHFVRTFVRFDGFSIGSSKLFLNVGLRARVCTQVFV